MRLETGFPEAGQKQLHTGYSFPGNPDGHCFWTFLIGETQMQCKLLALLPPVPKYHKDKVLKKPLTLKTNSNMCICMLLYDLCTICVPGALRDQKRVSDSEPGGAV